MAFLYSLGIKLYTLLVRMASLKNAKAADWINGRKDILHHIQNRVDANVQYTWFHFASLGEFEQGRPVLEKLKANDPNVHILITFFSPSGYNIRKDYPLADHVFYLPVDSDQNAKEFIRLINPKLAVFTKYEYWYYYFKELHHQQIPLYIISGIFRKEQAFFKWYGSLHRQMLHYVTHFFVQNEESKTLLKNLGIEQISISGDTRFDRVAQNALVPKQIDHIKEFCGNQKVFIAGSTWPEDEVLIAKLASQNPDLKFIIAPHEITEEKILALEKLLPQPSIRYSQLSSGISNLRSQISDLNTQYPILIIDNIGMLSSLYQYADIAYIGGGFGAGIHNTLEAAAFGLPLIFGPNYQKFQEAKDLIKAGAAFPIKDFTSLKHCFEKLLNENNRVESGKLAKEYIQRKLGATQIITDHLLMG